MNKNKSEHTEDIRAAEEAMLRERCARCGKERQSHAYVSGVYGYSALFVCPTAVFASINREAQEG